MDAARPPAGGGGSGRAGSTRRGRGRRGPSRAHRQRQVARRGEAGAPRATESEDLAGDTPGPTAGPGRPGAKAGPRKGARGLAGVGGGRRPRGNPLARRRPSPQRRREPGADVPCPYLASRRSPCPPGPRAAWTTPPNRGSPSRLYCRKSPAARPGARPGSPARPRGLAAVAPRDRDALVPWARAHARAVGPLPALRSAGAFTGPQRLDGPSGRVATSRTSVPTEERPRAGVTVPWRAPGSRGPPALRPDSDPLIPSHSVASAPL